MAANGNGTGDDAAAAAAGTCISSDIIHRLQGLTVGISTSNATQLGAMSIQPTPVPPLLANNASSSLSKGWDSSKIMAARLARLRRRRLFDGRLPTPSVISITEELQNLTVGAAAVFRPTPEELIGRFLRPKLAAGEPLPRAARFIHDADVYAAAPDHLAATHAPAPVPAGVAKLVWYFFSPLYFQPDMRHGRIPWRRVGGGGGGTWKSAAGRWKLAEEGEAANWYATNLAYYDDHELRLTEWRMREYGIAKRDGGWQQPLVLCQLFRTPSSGGRRRRIHE